jgi:hypothetical protein
VQNLRKIGIVASGCTELGASVILAEGEEKQVKAEDLVVVRNRNGNEIMAVCRNGLGSNENLKIGAYSPGVAYARIGHHPSNAKEYYAFGLDIVGDVSTEDLRENKMLIAPSSDVELYEEHDNPMACLGTTPNSIGYYKDHPNWKVPINPNYICYHMGVFASTGAGKSLLTRYQIIPFIGSAGYDVLIFDWKGSDYASHFQHTLDISDIGLDDDVVVEYLCSAMDNFGYYVAGMVDRNPIKTALENVIYEGGWRSLSTTKEVRKHIEEKVCSEIASDQTDASGKVNRYGLSYIRKFQKALNKVTEDELENTMGKMGPSEIIEETRKQGIAVIDVSSGGKEQKLSVFLSIAKWLRQLMENKEKLNLAVIIDEGPQYCPFKPQGIENRTTETISDLCALGRSYNLAIILLSQGIAGEIGINAAIRRNLNTQFIGKLNPLDLDEAVRLLGQVDINPKYLILMPVGDFYIAGKMNPSPIPLLIHFDIPESEKNEDKKWK